MALHENTRSFEENASYRADIRDLDYDGQGAKESWTFGIIPVRLIPAVDGLDVDRRGVVRLNLKKRKQDVSR